MRVIPFYIVPLAVALAGCGQESQVSQQAAAKPEPVPQIAAPAPVAETPAVDEKSMTDKAKEMYQATLDKTGDMTEAVVDKSREMYESAREKTGEVTEAAVDKSKAAWDKTTEAATGIVDKSKEVGSEVVDKSREYYESAKKKAAEMLDDKNNVPVPPPAPVESRES